jgi:hypothetical protein
MTRDASPIAALNDAFRQAGPVADWYVTAGLNAYGDAFVARVIEAVRAFDAFEPGNDPYGEHDFGAVTVEGVTVWFKIDCYDTRYAWASPDPTRPDLTRRVLTLLLPEDY